MTGSKLKNMTSEQKRRLFEILDLKPGIRLGISSNNYSRKRVQHEWVSIAEELNLLVGPKKNWKGWRSSFYDLTRRSKEKLAEPSEQLVINDISPSSQVYKDTTIKKEDEEHSTSVIEPANPCNYEHVPEPAQNILNHCRLCLKPYANRSINNKISKINTIWEKIRDLVNIQIHPSDGLPEKICAVCFAQLKACLNFIWKCKDTDKKLRNIVYETKKENNNIEIENKRNNSQLINEESEKLNTVLKEDDNFVSTIINKDLILEIENIEDKVEHSEDFTHNEENYINFSLELDQDVNLNDNDDCDDDDNEGNYIIPSYNKPKKARKPWTRRTGIENNKFPIPGQEKKTRKPRRRKSDIQTKKMYQCTVCGIFVSNITTHLNMHNGIKRFTCDYCGRSFASKEFLPKHMRIHTNEKPFSCDTCGKRFNFKEGLDHHMLDHTGEKPYVCSVCGKSYKASGTLQYHVKYHHTSVRNFPCTECKFTGITRSILRKHVRKVHTKLEYVECNICGKVLSQSSHLKRHMMIHAGEKPFQCKHCPARFIQKSDMVKHEQSHGKPKKRKQSDSDEE